MNRKKLSMLLLCFMMLGLTACGNAIPEMTEQENAMVSEYAANLLLQYSGSYHSRLVDTSDASLQPDVEQDNKQENEQATTETVSDNVQSDDYGQEEDTQATDSGEQAESVLPENTPAMTIEMILGLQDISVQYTGYRLCDSYPEESASEEDLFFAMQAASGSKLLVLDLDVVNQTDAAAICNTIAIPAKYRVVLNGEHTQNVLVTMLLDDFSAMDIQLEPGETRHAVLVAELTQEKADALQSVGLEIKLDDKKTVITQ